MALKNKEGYFLLANQTGGSCINLNEEMSTFLETANVPGRPFFLLWKETFLLTFAVKRQLLAKGV